MASTTHEALLAELLGDVGAVHDSIKELDPALDKLLVELPAAMRQATANAIAQVEKVAEAQTLWINQETLKEREEFIAAQKAAYEGYEARMKALIEVQNTALESVLLRTGGMTADAIKRAVAAEVQAAVASVPRADNKNLVIATAIVGGVMILLSVAAFTLTFAIYMHIKGG